MSPTIYLVIAIALLLPGIFMAFVPMLPALSYMFVIALIFSLFTGFAPISGAGVLILLLITAASVIVDHTSGLLGAKYGGAHSKSLLWGMLGAFLGFFMLPAFGSFIGLFLGVFIAELYYKKHHPRAHEQAIKAASGALIGSAVGVGVNVILALIFVATFLILALA